MVQQNTYLNLDSVDTSQTFLQFLYDTSLTLIITDRTMAGNFEVMSVKLNAARM